MPRFTSAPSKSRELRTGLRPAPFRVWPYALVAAVFFVSRVAGRVLLGLRFDHLPLSGRFIQYVDPLLLQQDFWRSLLYLHHQAPLQNALVGAALLWFPPTVACQFLDALYVALGLCLVLGVLHAMLRLGASRWVATVTTAIFAVVPSTLLYENWLLYHLPTACFLALSLVALIHYQRVGTLRAGLAFFGLIMTAALFRSTLGWMLLAAALALLLVRPPLVEPRGIPARKTVLRAAALPLFVLVLNSWKPSLLIGYGYGEALLWGNLSVKIYDHLHPFEQQQLAKDGVVSPAVRSFCLDSLDCIAHVRMPHAPTGIPLLDLDRTPGGWANAHALEFLLIARKYYKPDALFLLSHYPGAYLRSVAYALGRNAASTTNDDMMSKSWNYHQLHPWDEALQKLCGRDQDGRLLLLLIGLPAMVVYGIGRVLRAGGARRSGWCAATAIAYMLLVIGYVTGVTTGASYGDFSRYRFDVNPLYVVLLGLMLSDLQRAAMVARRRVGVWLEPAVVRLFQRPVSRKPRI